MSTLSPELQYKQWLSVSNIYTRSKEYFEPGIPTMAYKTPLPTDTKVKQQYTTFQKQFPSKGGEIPCENYYTAGAEPAQWCQPWGGQCPLGRRVVPSRRADPVMDRGDVPVEPAELMLEVQKQGISSGHAKTVYIIIFALLLIFTLRKFY